MSGPSRELPPLRISIVGDNSSAVKAIQGTVKAAQDANKEITKDFKKTSRSMQAEMQERMRRMQKIDSAYRKDREKEDKQNQARVKAVSKEQESQYKTDRARSKAVEDSRNAIKRQTEQVQKEQEHATRRIRIRKRDRLLNAKKQAEDQANEDARVLRRSRLRLRDRLREQRKQAEEQAAEEARVLRRSRLRLRDRLLQQKKEAEEQAQAQVRATRRSRLRLRDRLIRQRKEAEAQAAEDARILRRSRIRLRDRLRQERADRERAERERIASDQRILRRSRQRQVRRLAGQRDAFQARGQAIRQGFSGMSGSSLMGARADIYMHREAITSMIGMAKQLMTPYAQVENYTIQMEAFAGSADEAAKAVETLQKFAISSPYTLEGVLDASTTMMKYGADTEHAIAMTKLLGDVAAGNTNKLELMALAVGQAEALGRLQGQELRQMVNAGFNPLSVAAKELAMKELGQLGTEEQIKETAKKYMAEFQDAMRKSKLDSGIIEAALQIATSKGGDFAGLSDKQASSLTGLANQILETLDLAAIEVVKVFAGDLIKLMKVIKQYVDAAIVWMRTNKEAVKEFVLMGIGIAKWILIFSAVAMAIAYVKWIIGSLTTVMMVAVGAGRLLRTVILGLIWVYEAWTLAAAGSWLAVLGPIALVTAAIVALALIMNGLLHEGGFMGVIADWTKWLVFFAGFFWNFSHNISAMFDWIANNWRAMLRDMVLAAVKPVLDLAHMFAKLLGSNSEFGKFREWYAGYIGKQFGVEGGTGYNNTGIKTDFGMSNPFAGLTDSVKAALDPHIVKEIEKLIAEKPDIDFNKFIGGKGDDGVGTYKPKKHDHVTMNSNEHAWRLYKFNESEMAASDASKKSHEKKTEELLEEIAKNTRPKTVSSFGGIEMARLDGPLP